MHTIMVYSDYRVNGEIGMNPLIPPEHKQSYDLIWDAIESAYVCGMTAHEVKKEVAECWKQAAKDRLNDEIKAMEK
jgi:hypothetical protein